MSTTPTPQPRLGDLAAAAKSDRNRAVDAYRALAMVVVAIGHWAAVAVTTDADGDIVAGNALGDDPSLAWLTWIFQVMPLFFVVGGFASAMSLDAHTRAGTGRPADWIAGRLRRMVAPTAVLAGTWAVLLVGGVVTGAQGLVGLGVVAAAIPLWFLANYTIDTAFAPYLLPRFRRRPVGVAGGLLTVFATVETLHFVGVPIIGHLNWVIGWLLFQVAGFAWRDELLPTSRRLVAVAGLLWCAALAAVHLGPWPAAMVHFPGLDHSPTHPPSVALVLFGAAYSATAIALAPLVTRWLAANRRAWSLVVAGNAVSMSVYLWHMTAMIGAGLVFYAFGWLPTATVGEAAWWLQKAPLMLTALVLLVALVAVVARHEQRALLAPTTPWTGGAGSMIATAAAVSTALKLWSTSSPVTAAVGLAALLALWHLVLRREPTSIEAEVA
ncbi:MAG: acyltransferase [Acidimicrobiia bacterium]|nr:acyltransferase [Acidimicrobiia bacterium]